MSITWSTLLVKSTKYIAKIHQFIFEYLEICNDRYKKVYLCCLHLTEAKNNENLYGLQLIY